MFLDYNQNAKDRTVASAYSVRPLPDARVSTPLTWDEVPTVEAEAFTIATVPARFAEIGDPGAGIDDAVGSLEALLELSPQARGGGRRRCPVAAELREAGRRAAAGPAVAQAPAGLGVRAGSRRGRRPTARGRRGARCRGRRRRPERRPADRVGGLTPDADGPAQDERPGHRDLARGVEGRGARGPGALEGPPSESAPTPSSRPTSWSMGCAAAHRSGTGSASTSPTSRRPSGPPRKRSIPTTTRGPATSGRTGRASWNGLRARSPPRGDAGQARCRRRTPKPPSQRRTIGSHAALTSAWAPTARIREQARDAQHERRDRPLDASEAVERAVDRPRQARCRSRGGRNGRSARRPPVDPPPVPVPPAPTGASEPGARLALAPDAPGSGVWPGAGVSSRAWLADSARGLELAPGPGVAVVPGAGVGVGLGVGVGSSDGSGSDGIGSEGSGRVGSGSWEAEGSDRAWASRSASGSASRRPRRRRRGRAGVGVGGRRGGRCRRGASVSVRAWVSAQASASVPAQ